MPHLLEPSPSWTDAPDDQLYAVDALDDTPLAAIPRRTRYALIATGVLGSVSIGARRYVTRRAILDFIRRHERGGEHPEVAP